jgi:Leucine-rich repeat (LRR) protein
VLTGSIPTELGLFSSLEEFWLSGLNLTGSTLPSELGLLTDVNILAIYDDFLAGPIPSEIGQLSNMTLLTIDGNQLSGLVPSELGSMPNMAWILLYDNGKPPLQITSDASYL